MEMWLKRSTLMLLATALVVSGLAPVILDETQTRVEVPYGSSVTFHCRLRTETHGRLWVSWYFNPSGCSFNDIHKFQQDVVNKSAKTSTEASNETKAEGQDTEEPVSKCTLANATESGWYFCRVTIEIPLLTEINSSGTEVIITKSKENTTYPSGEQENLPLINSWMWIILGVSAFILIVLLVICVLLRRRRRRSRGEDPIYANTRPVANKQPSPRPAMVNLKTASSSQNLRNPGPGRRRDEGKQRYKQ